VAAIQKHSGKSASRIQGIPTPPGNWAFWKHNLDLSQDKEGDERGDFFPAWRRGVSKKALREHEHPQKVRPADADGSIKGTGLESNGVVG
jgi:hypothetical protein